MNISVLKLGTLFFVLFSSAMYAQLNLTTPQDVCYGASKSYIVDAPWGKTGSVYDWRVIEGTFKGSINFTVSGKTNSVIINWKDTPAGIYTVGVIESNSGCNGAEKTLQVTIKALPTVTLSMSAICEGSPVTVKAIPDPADPGNNYTYIWTVPPGVPNPGSVSAFTINNATLADAGVYSVTVKDKYGCSSAIARNTLVVNPLPVVSIAQPNPSAFCAGDPIVLTAVTPGTGTLTYQWKKGTANISGATSQTYTVPSNITVAETANYTVTVKNTVTNCVATSNAVTVTIKPLPVVSITPANPSAFCAGDSVVLTATASGTGTLQYQWKKGAANISGATSATYTIPSNITVAETAYYTVKVTDNNNCPVEAKAVRVTVNPLPKVSVTPANPPAFCAGNSVVLTAVASGTGTLKYQWEKGTANIPGAITQTYTVPSNITVAETANYTVKVTDGNNCTAVATAAVTVTVKPLPEVSIAPANPSAFCAGDYIVLTATASGTGTLHYQWKKGTADIIGATSATYTVPSNITVAETANYTVKVTDDNCTADATAVTVTVNPVPTAAITDSALAPVGGTALETNGKDIILKAKVTGRAPLSYQWKKNGVNIGNATGSDYIVEADENATVTGVYTVVVTDANSCTSAPATAVTVTIKPLPKVSVTPANPPAFCAGNSVVLTATASGTGTLKYQWKKDSAVIPGETTPTYTVPSNNITVAETADYTVKVTDDNNYPVEATAVRVTINPLPVLSNIKY